VRWITIEELNLIHVRQVELFGGSHGVLDKNAMDSALYKAQNLNAYEPDSDLAALAASYLCGFVQKQVFVDGNKRTGLAIALTFLRLNGYELNVDKAELLAFVLSIARNEMDQPAAAMWLRQRITAR
jgi:death-on-curing protein